MIYRLIVLNGAAKGTRITIDPDPMTLGRETDCDISLPDEEIALHHARIEQRGSELFISDLGSMNKIILNKHEVQHSRLKHGDIFELGRTRLLVEAIVQAEVQSSNEIHEVHVNRGRKRLLAIAASLLLLAGATFAIMGRDEPTIEQAAEELVVAVAIDPQPAEVEIPPAAAAIPPVEEIVIVEKPAIDDELKKIREDLSSIQEHIQQLNNTATLLSSQESTPPAEPVSASGRNDVDDIEVSMTAARQALESSDFAGADVFLEHLQLEYPDYLPAYELRARVFEEQNMPDRALEQWSAILKRSTGSELYRRAAMERLRLSRVESRQLPSAHEAVRIKSVDPVRFPESADHDEMRTINIQLSYDRNLGPIDPKGVRLLVYFFEQDIDTRRVALSSVQPYAEANLSALPQAAENLFSCAVNYVAPKGYYQRDLNTSRQRYYGFIARLHYFDNLIDEQARPANLLDPAILQSAGLAVQTANNQSEPASGQTF